MKEKVIKIAALAIISVAAFCAAYHFYFTRVWDDAAATALTMSLLTVFFMAFGELAATIFKNRFGMYVLANIVPALIFIPNAAVFTVLANADFNYPEVIFPGISAKFWWNWFIFGIPVVASIIVGRFVFHRKKLAPQTSEASN